MVEGSEPAETPHDGKVVSATARRNRLAGLARRPSPLSSEDEQSAGIGGGPGHDEAGDRVTIKLGQPE